MMVFKNRNSTTRKWLQLLVWMFVVTILSANATVSFAASTSSENSLTSDQYISYTNIDNDFDDDNNFDNDDNFDNDNYLNEDNHFDDVDNFDEDDNFDNLNEDTDFGENNNFNNNEDLNADNSFDDNENSDDNDFYDNYFEIKEDDDIWVKTTKIDYIKNNYTTYITHYLEKNDGTYETQNSELSTQSISTMIFNLYDNSGYKNYSFSNLEININEPEKVIYIDLYFELNEACYTIEYYCQEEIGSEIYYIAMTEELSAKISTPVTASFPNDDEEFLEYKYVPEKSIADGIVLEDNKLTLKIFCDYNVSDNTSKKIQSDIPSATNAPNNISNTNVENVNNSDSNSIPNNTSLSSESQISFETTNKSNEEKNDIFKLDRESEQQKLSDLNSKNEKEKHEINNSEYKAQKEENTEESTIINPKKDISSKTKSILFISLMIIIFFIGII